MTQKKKMKWVKKVILKMTMNKYHIGAMVVRSTYFPGKEQQPIYKIKDKNEEGQYLIEQWNVNEGDTVSPDRWG